MIASLILVAFTFAGETLLSLLGITLPAFRVAGGLLLFWTAFEMVFEKRQERRSSSVDRAISRDHIRNIAVFPLAIPLISGPGSISAVILLSSQSETILDLAALIGVILGLVLSCLLVFIAATPIDKMLGETGRVVLTRLLGVILSALAVQFVADGVKALMQA